MRPWLAAADIVVAPLTIARGVQNKVLEAMAMARPTIASSEAATGIGAHDGEHLLVRDDNADFAAAIVELDARPELAKSLGVAARSFVVEHKGWQGMLADLPDLVGMATRMGDAARDAA